jgi:protein ImuB
MQVTEATAFVAGLTIARVTHAEIEAELGRVAELAMSLAPTVSIRLAADDVPIDTVWLDITGSAHLVGGEEALALELVERAAALGHGARAAISDGPRSAQALARYAPPHVHAPIAPPGRVAEAMAPLPALALPLADPAEGARAGGDLHAWFLRLGLVTAGDLAKLPRAALAARIPGRSRDVIDLLDGRDPLPLLPYEPPRVLVEEAAFEEGVENVEALLFVLRGMTSRIGARLAARGEACARLEVEILLDPSIAALREALNHVELVIELPAPLSAEADLLRTLRARLERVEIGAPAVRLRLVTPTIVRARRVQLDLSRGKAANPDALPVLLAELSAEIGADHVGVLAVRGAHAPEGQSALVPVDFTGAYDLSATPHPRTEARGTRVGDAAASIAMNPLARVTRLLPSPIPLGEIAMQRVVAIDQGLFAAEPRAFLLRLSQVGWWTPAPISRDYMTAWFSSGDASRRGGAPPIAGEGLVYVDRATQASFLQGWLD